MSETKTTKKSKSSEKEMSFLEHLEELRWHIVKSIVALIILSILAFVFKSIVFDYVLFGPRTSDFITNSKLCELGKLLNSNQMCINQSPFEIININMAGQFSMHVKVSVLIGFILAFPYIFWQFWKFVRPALHTHERKHARGAVFWSSGLFLTGISFGYFLIMPLTVHFFSGYFVSEQVKNQINLESYISVFNSVVLSSGIIFELPILIFFLARVGIVTASFLKKFRKHAIVLILLLSAIITPPDVFSQILVGVPLYLLFEISIIVAGRIEKNKLNI